MKPWTAKISAKLCALLCAALLAGCGTLPGVSQQGKAGITEAAFKKYCPVGPRDAPTSYVVCAEASLVDGKEREGTFFTYDPDTGAFTYSAGVSRAFTGQEIRGEVEKALAAKGVEATEALVEGILKALKMGAVPF